MTTLAPERLAQVAADWRSGIDFEDLPNPAGLRFGEYTVHEITMTGVPPITQCTVDSFSLDPVHGACFCCHLP